VMARGNGKEKFSCVDDEHTLCSAALSIRLR
jgi:hypothetical protein